MSTNSQRNLRAIQQQGVPLLDLKRQYETLKDKINNALVRVCDSGWFVLGPDVRELEKNVAEYCQANHAIGCASGSDALLLALMALDIGLGDEVILPSFTFFATASAVTRLGATPKFADIEPDTFNMDPEHVEQLIGPRTRAILPVHLFGQVADMQSLCSIAKQHQLPVVEDAAQSIGAELNGRRAGSIGDVGCFSFYPTKNLGGAGDGGMITTNDDQLAERFRLLRGHGMDPRYYHSVVGINSRLDSFQAAVLNIKLPYLDQWSDMRQENAQRYTDMMIEAGLDQHIVLPTTAPRRRHVWNQYTIRVQDGRREELRQFLTDAKIGSEIYYPLGLHEQQCFKYLGYREGELPETEAASQEVIALPIFPELTADEQQVVVDRLAMFYSKPEKKRSTVQAPHFLKKQAGQRAEETIEIKEKK